MTITNNGPDAAGSVVMVSDLPASTTFVSCAATGGGVCGGSGNNRTVSFTSLAPSASATITLVARVNCSVANGTISNTATVNAATSDSNPGNNSATTTTTVTNSSAISPTNQSFLSQGGSGSFSVTAPSSCAWTASTSDLWISITPPGAGSGNGTVSYSVAQNTSSSQRVGTITTNGLVGGLIHTVTQAGTVACPTVTAINPTSSAVGSNVTLTGTNFSGVSSVKFSNNVTATFTVVNNTTITTAVPSGAVSGPITISKTGCNDVQTASFTVTIVSNCVPVSLSAALTGGTGSSLTVPIIVGDLTGKGVTAYDFTLTFDPAVIKPSSTPVDSAGTLTSGLTVTPNTATPGKLTVSAFGTTPLTGAGTLLNLKFDLIGVTSACSSLAWTNFVFNEGLPCATTSNGQICIGGGAISGTVNYGTSSTPKTVPGATLTAAGTPSATSTTNSAGAYNLMGLGGGPYTVTPTKSGDVNGISSFDASLVAQHAASVITLTANQQIAGDASGNGAVSSFDASLIAQTVAGTPNSGIAGTWKFVPANRSYPTLSGNQTNQNFDAILVGDVSGNWTPPAPLAASLAAALSSSESQGGLADALPPVTVSLPNATGATGTTVTIPITVGDLTGKIVTAYDVTLTFDPAVLQALDADKAGTLSSGLNITLNTATPGRVTISAFGTAPLTGAGTLLNLRFNVVGAAGTTTALTWQSFNFNEGDPPATLVNGSLSVPGAGNPVPTLTSLNPNAVTAGGAAFTLTINGTNFINSSMVQFNGANRTTTFVSATQLTANITAADIATAGTVSVAVFNPGPGGGLSTALSFTISPPPIQRTLRVVSASAPQSVSVTVPIEMDAQGDENALQFSLSFDAALLTFTQAARGKDLGTSGLLIVNDTQAAQGQLGFLLALDANQTLTVGKRELLVLTFKAVGAPTQQTTTISFADTPISRLIGGVNGNTLSASYISGSFTISPAFEGDVSPAPSGDNQLDIFDVQRIGRFAAKLETAASGSEFQRADCAPKDLNKGNGIINIFDLQQAARYAAKLDPLVTVGGPTGSPIVGALAALVGAAAVDVESARRLRLVSTLFQRGQTNALRVELDALGDENALGFSLNYDPAVLRFAEAKVDGAVSGAMLMVNANDLAHGRVGFLLALPPGQKFAPGTQAFLTIRFAALPGSGPVTTRISFGDDPIERQLGDVQANAVRAAYADLTITINPEAVVSVSAASYREAAVASEAVAAAFGHGLATTTQAADTLPLPTSLGGTQVVIADSTGAARSAPLFFVSPGQINYQVPPGTATGAATVTVINGGGTTAIGSVQITDIAPGLFSANADGQGAAAAVAMRVKADGVVSYEPVAQLDQTQFVTAPISFENPSDEVYLLLFGTGLQHRTSLETVKAIIGGVEAEVLYAGPQGAFVGLDQINVRLPHSLMGRGEVNVVLVVDGQSANTVKIKVQ